MYERAKGTDAEEPFGTERDVYRPGHEFLVLSTAPCPVPKSAPRVRIGGPDCDRPYEMALLNVSAMSFGSLSANAVLALNGGAAAGNFAQDTGEGGLSRYHPRPGGDLAARAMMFAVGCIQAQRCHTNTCPTGVTSMGVADRPAARYSARSDGFVPFAGNPPPTSPGRRYTRRQGWASCHAQAVAGRWGRSVRVLTMNGAVPVAVVAVRRLRSRTEAGR
ncbi:glutamate synthase conserved region-containing protein [Streptomyces sp. LamerLS-31b]|nr:glutamate synthase conserved region-containing protein [Streptomyces sp. LamerLS-31b]